MKQHPNSSFEKEAKEALVRARQNNTVPMIMEAVDRAAMLIALSPEKVEEIFAEKMREGTKL